MSLPTSDEGGPADTTQYSGTCLCKIPTPFQRAVTPIYFPSRRFHKTARQTRTHLLAPDMAKPCRDKVLPRVSEPHPPRSSPISSDRPDCQEAKKDLAAVLNNPTSRR